MKLDSYVQIKSEQQQSNLIVGDLAAFKWPWRSDANGAVSGGIAGAITGGVIGGLLGGLGGGLGASIGDALFPD